MNLQVLKAENKSETNGLAIAYDEAKIKAKIAELPFPLTEAQQRSLSEILADMKSGAHMNRLLQGDVGSGKTVIASLAMYGLIRQDCSLPHGTDGNFSGAALSEFTGAFS